MARELVVMEEQQAQRFYDRLRSATIDWAAKRAGTTGQGLAGLLLMAPDVFILLWRLLRRADIPTRSRLLLAFALSYFVLPVDLVPDWLLGPLGFADDLMLAAAVLRTALVETPRETVQAEWSGNDSLIAVLSGVAKLADRLTSLSIFKPVQKMIRFLLK